MVAFRSFIDQPFFGSGLYTMGNKLLQYRSVPPSSIFVHAHNIYLNILGELGIVGLSIQFIHVGEQNPGNPHSDVLFFSDWLDSCQR